MAESQRREVTLTARFRDRLTKGLQRLRNALTGTSEASRRTARSGTALGRAFRGVRRRGRQLVSFLGKMRRAIFSLRAAVVLAVGALTGFFALRGIVRLIRGTTAEIDQLAKMSRRLGIPVEQLSKLQFAAERAGIASEQLMMAWQRLIRRASEAAKGTGEAVDAFRELGINAQEFIELRMEEQVGLLAERLSDVNNQADRTRLAMRFFDSEGVAMLQLLQDGGDAVRELFDEAERVNAVITEREAAIAERLADAFTRLKFAVRGIRVAILESLASFVERATNRLTGFLAKLEDRVRTVKSIFVEGIAPDATAEERKRWRELMVQIAEVIKQSAIAFGQILLQSFVLAARAGANIFALVFGEKIRNKLAELVPMLFEGTPEFELHKLRQKLEDIQGEAPVSEQARGALLHGFSGMAGGMPPPDTADTREARRARMRAQIAELEKQAKTFDKERERRIAQNLADAMKNFDKALFGGEGEGEGEVSLGALSKLNKLLDDLAASIDRQSERLQREATKPHSLPGFFTFAQQKALEFADVVRKQLGSERVRMLVSPLERGFQAVSNAITGATERVRDLGAVFDSQRVEMHARMLEALGQDRAAQRIRLQLRHRRELGEAQGEYLEQLREIHRLEMDRFDFETKRESVLDRLTKAQNRHRQAIELTNARMEAGTISPERGRTAIEDQDAKLQKALKRAEQGLQQLAQHPRFGEEVASDLNRVRTEIARLKAELDETSRTFGEGFTRGIGEFMARAEDAFANGRQLASNLASTLSDNLGGAISGVIEGTKSMGQAFRQFAAQTLQDISRMIVRMITMRIVSSAFGGFGFSPTPAAQGFAQGGVVGGPQGVNADVVPAMLTPGERVFSVPTVDYYGEPFIDALMSGSIPRSATESISASVARNTVPRTNFNQGGQVEASASAQSPMVAALPANEQTMQELANGGSPALIRWVRDHQAEINGILGRG